MRTNIINEYVLELVQETSMELVKIYHNKPIRKTLLRFSNYRNGNQRISEQEMRFVFATLHGKFSHPGLTYSIETPTKEEYSFSGKEKRSAASDFSFYDDNNNSKPIINIEFKAHNIEQSAVDKDIEKLISEKTNGAWIHVFENENSGTVETLFDKFKNAFEKFPKSNKSISFHILILRTGTLLSRKGYDNEITDLENRFNIHYEMWKDLKVGSYQFINGKPTTENNPQEDWQIIKFEI